MGSNSQVSTPVVVIASFAGGVGKTTLAHALAVASAEFGKKSLLIDLDKSGSLTFKLGFERTRENVITCSERFDLRPHTATDSLTELLSQIPEKYDLVLVDSTSFLTSELDQVLKLAQLVLLPVRESIHSLRGALSVMKITAAPCKALPLFKPDDSELAKLIAAELDLLDGEISISDEVLQAESKSVSVLTDQKNSEVSQQYRDATYSLLEELKIF
jgi:cellulose biosynthesis protein BcsQ